MSIAAALLLAIAACGGGGGSGGEAGATQGSLGNAGQAAAPDDKPATRAAAARFLDQATFGATPAEIDELMRIGTAAWIDRQFTLGATSHRAHWEGADAALRIDNPDARAGQDAVFESFWKQALTGPDQLRLRVAFALSQIFVISGQDGTVGGQPRAMAAWLDLLGEHAFGSYRTLLERVTLHPLMGSYLSHIRNRKADAATGRVPDQNYAREVMQLFSIGLVRLNRDGTPQLGPDGQPVETYGPADVAGLSHVFTGFSWACPGAPTHTGCFNNGAGAGGATDPDRWIKSMVGYPAFHSTEAKTFLGTTIPAQTTADPAASLRIALDTLAAHPNVGPFIGRQLIQRLVTSNPSPAYVRAVATAFDDNGSGVRGDLKAVIKAVLLHPEARRAGDDGSSGKLREPVHKLAALLRAFPHDSASGAFRIGNTDNPGTSLGQTVLRAPSVFNFFRPGFVAPGTQTAAAGLVAPEMQLHGETSAAGWINFMRDGLASGFGLSANGRRDLQRNWSAETALAHQPAELVAQLAGQLAPGRFSSTLQSEIAEALASIAIPALNAQGTNQAAIDAARRNRVNAALLLLVATPEYALQN